MFILTAAFYDGLFPCRVTREGKERRRLWAQRKTPRPSKKPKDDQEIAENGIEEDGNESPERRGMLPNEIVNLLAAREKYDIFMFLVNFNHKFSIFGCCV